MPNSDTSTVMRLEFEASLDELVHTRSIYTVLDMLGDIGGLLDMMTFIFKLVWSVVYSFSGSEISRFLLSALFFKYRRGQDSRMTGDITGKQ